MDGNKEVSIVLAVRNEEKYLRRCLESLLNQKYPQDKLEIIVVDGQSNDGTVHIVQKLKERLPNLIILLDNPKRTAASGRNIGIRYSSGKYVLILSGHTYVHDQCIELLVDSLNSVASDIAGIGATFESPEDETLLGKIIGKVQSSVLGGFGSNFRNKGGYVDTAAFVLYRKKVLEEVGLHDERFEMAQDLEINWRIRKKGLKLKLSSAAKIFYYRRHCSFKLLFKRMFMYGVGRAIFVKKHPNSFRIYFCIPSVILILIACLPFASIFPIVIFYGLLVALGSYVISVVISAISLYLKCRSIKFFISTSVYFTEHIAFGLGFLIGMVKK